MVNPLMCDIFKRGFSTKASFVWDAICTNWLITVTKQAPCSSTAESINQSINFIIRQTWPRTHIHTHTHTHTHRQTNNKNYKVYNVSQFGSQGSTGAA